MKQKKEKNELESKNKKIILAIIILLITIASFFTMMKYINTKNQTPKQEVEVVVWGERNMSNTEKDLSSYNGGIIHIL